jgi:hypothetical protein
MSNCFGAHSDPDATPTEPGSKWQLLRDHLIAVSKLSRELAEAAALMMPTFMNWHLTLAWYMISASTPIASSR